MENRIGIFFSIFLFFTGYNTPLLFAAKEIQKNDTSSIQTDYLDQLPSNDYIVGPGDKIIVRVSSFYPELNSIRTIDAEGTIYLPKLKRVYVQDLTLNELNAVLNDAFKEFVRFPSVEVEILNYRPLQVFVKGEVENPGIQILKGSFSVSDISPKQYIENQLILKNNTNKISDNRGENDFFFPTIFDALRSSGGITQYSDLSKIQVIRKETLSNGGGKKITNLNFEDVIISGDNSQNIRVYDGDIIDVKKSDTPNYNLLTKSILSRLSPKFLNVFVTGRVNNPGSITVSKASVLADAINMAGGTKVLKGPVTFIRFNNDGSIDKRKFRFNKNIARGGYKNPLLRNGDLIIVGENLITTANSVINEFTSPFVGIFSTYGLIKAISD